MNRILQKYKRVPQAAKVSIWFMICNVFQKGIAFMTMPIYTRLLTTEEYGTYSVYTTWMYTIAIFASLNLSSGGYINIGLLKYEDKKLQFISSVQGLSTVSTIVVFGISFIAYDCFYELTGLSMQLMLIMAVQVLFSTPVLYWSAKQRFEYKYVKVVIVTLLSYIATVAVSFFMIFELPDKSYSLVLGSAIVQIIVGIYFYGYNLYCGNCFYNKEIWKNSVVFGLVLIPHYLAYQVLNSSDRVMINAICSTSEAGIYSVACQISIAINLVTAAIDASLNPWVYQKMKSREYEKIARTTNYVVLFMSVATIGCVLIAPEILLIAAPIEYQSAKWVMPPVIAGCFYLYLAGCFMRVAFYHEKKKIITGASAAAAILNIVLNLIFIPRYGFMAAAYTTLLSYMFFAIVHYVGMRKICKAYQYNVFPFNCRVLFIIALITTIASMILLFLYESIVWRYCVVCVFIIVVIACRNKISRIYNGIKLERMDDRN